MLKELNEVLYQKAFATLILDYHYNASDGLPEYTSGRVLIDGVFSYRWHTETIAEAVELFRRGELANH